MLAGAAAVAIMLVAYYLPPVLAARSALDGARRLEADVRSVRPQDLNRSTVGRLRAEISGIRDDLASARMLVTADAFVGLARSVPAVGTQLRAAASVTGAAAHMLDAGDAALDVAGRVVAVREGSAGGLLSGLVGIIATSTPDVDRLHASIEAADEQLAAVGPDAAGEIRAAAGTISAAAAHYKPLVELYRQVDDVLPGMVGWNGADKRYLVLAQDPAELRPTGGFSGTIGIVTFSGGRLASHEFRDVITLDVTATNPYVEPPDGLRSHLLGDASWQLADANWSPDWPTAAQDAMRLYSLETGDTHIDGVIALTTFALDRILEVIGPVDVPEYGVTVHAGQVTMTALHETRGLSGDPSERKAFLNAFANLVMERLLALPPEQWQPMWSAMQDVFQRRLLMAWSADPAAEALLAAGPVGGPVRRDPGDYLYVVESNVAPTSKYNLVVGRTSDFSVTLGADGSAEDVLALHWQNDADKGGDPYRSLRRYSTSQIGLYGAYVRVLRPSGTEVVDVSGNSGGPITGAESIAEEAGRASVANYLLIAPGSADLTYRWHSDGVAQPVDGAWLYRLTVQKQPGMSAEPLTVRVSLPPGAVVLSSPPGSTIEGGDVLVSTTLESDQDMAIRYRLP
ncbi:MAG: hypothetical protein QOH61_1742 [Chloroflexota bacterium]|nr:hypothetical protein [Chloroflexota bacterium]